jgi:predicted TIM-barrel fold metal-dependent hydrolase
MYLMKAASTDSDAKEKKQSRNRADQFVDAHVHIWTNDFRKYPLAPGFKVEEMEPEVFLPENILPQANPVGVKRVVLVQMSYYGFDNSYMLDVIRSLPEVFRGIAVIDWKGEAPEASMRELAKHGVRGFRIYAASPSTPERDILLEPSPAGWLEGEGFNKMFRCGAEERLAICALVNPNELPELDRQCKRFPDTPVIIDHLARVGMKGGIMDVDVRALCAFARHPQVRVKLSGFYALGQARPPHLDLAPLIRQVYEAFGPQRLMWGSDCPFQIMRETYDDSFSLVRDRLDFLSAEDKNWILGQTAEEFFFQ